ncbi:hypothetical protein MLAC_32290 [Mycobacterium lacus]|uniref:PPE domain-containing protein n=1 Tax=Mycobacterium lacus TaxID=169765 RepID=A0A7I7NMR5_9MYCO|nr:hypothetical protein MLAC_32290 [Mycobacterium lacus]
MAMAAAAVPYARWLSTAADRAGAASAQAKAAAAVYEAARAAVVHPVSVAANRSELVSLVIWNLFGQNAPAIAATEAEYEEMWAQDVSVMVDYHGEAAAVAAQLSPWEQAPGVVAPAQGVTEYGAILAFVAVLASLATSTRDTLQKSLQNSFDAVTDALNAVASCTQSTVASQRAFNESELNAARTVITTDGSAAVSALRSGDVTGAALNVAGAGLYAAGTAVSLGSSNLTFPLTLLGADLQAAGTALAP